jgi:hypothetical protein
MAGPANRVSQPIHDPQWQWLTTGPRTMMNPMQPPNPNPMMMHKPEPPSSLETNDDHTL